MRPGTRLQEGKPSKRPPVSVSAAPASPPGATRTLSLGPMPPRGPSPRASAPGSGAGSHLAHEVREVEYGHDEDGQPLAQDAVADLGLKTREQAQRDEIGHGDGQHVGPDDAGHHVAVQQQGCGRRRGSEAGSPKAPRPPGHPHVRRPDDGVQPAPTSEGGPAAPDSRLRHVEARVGSPAAGHFMGWAVLWGPAICQGWALVLLEEGRAGPGFGCRPLAASRPPSSSPAVQQTRQAPPSRGASAHAPSSAPPRPSVGLRGPLHARLVSALSHSSAKLPDHLGGHSF